MPLSKNSMGLYEQVIDDKAYEMSKWGAEDSMGTLFDIGSLIGRPLGAAVKDFRGLDDTQGEVLIGTIIDTLSTAMGDKKSVSMAVIKKLVAGEHILCDGRKLLKFSQYTDLMHIFKVAKFAVQVQYGDFFGALPLSRIAPKAFQGAPPQATSTGPSGGPSSQDTAAIAR